MQLSDKWLWRLKCEMKCEMKYNGIWPHVEIWLSSGVKAGCLAGWPALLWLGP